MATLSKSKTYITATFRIWYDPKSDSVHVTNDDPDFGENGMHLRMPRGKSSDRNARAALAKYGIQHEREVSAT